MPLAAPVLLRRRLARGKELPERWREKLGHPSAPRPDGPLLWINAVGLGEVLSLRGLITSLIDQQPNLHLLVTSSTADSARVFAANRPPQTTHQFLPLDATPFRHRFLDHWRPNAAIWAEQDLWPGFVLDLERRGIPQAIVAARMSEKAFKSRQKAKTAFAHLFARMAFISAQTPETASRLRHLGAPRIDVGGSLKPAAPPLAYSDAQLAQARARLGQRFIWTVGSSYPEDEALALAAQDRLRQDRPDALLILAPRQTGRDFASLGPLPRKSNGDWPDPDDPVWLADTMGELGLIYRLSTAVLMGGTFNAIGGHNPWEPATLGCAVLHGPKTSSFSPDFNTLAASDACLPVATADQIAAALNRSDLADFGQRAQATARAGQDTVAALAQRIVAMMAAS